MNKRSPELAAFVGGAGTLSTEIGATCLAFVIVAAVPAVGVYGTVRWLLNK
ncbi:hypothetical protein HY085_03325 [Candidatus Gottesmanbacteria bacterium]|nr:hypothetical protein [Candidatus Gottesmanbacteria bacterium]